MYRLTNEILLIHSLVSYLKKKEKKRGKEEEIYNNAGIII